MRGARLSNRTLSAASALCLLSARAFGLDAPNPDTLLRPHASYHAPSLWRFLVVGYLLTVAVEAPVLAVGLPKVLSLRRRLFAGLWLTACTYPVVVLVLPQLFDARGLYLLVAETFAPAAECALFWLAFRGGDRLSRRAWARSFVVIVFANLLSFGVGLALERAGWL